MLALLLMLTSAEAASLDLLEVGGVWGTPGATNPTAVWWNPAGLAAGSGTQFLIEGAPTFATVNYNRTNPDYDFRTDMAAPDFDYGGKEKLKFAGPVPFIGVSSDFGVKDLGVGLSLQVPFARGGTQEPMGGPGQFHLKDGMIQAIYLSAGAGWTFFDKVSIGLSGSMVESSWSARTQVETLDALRDGIQDFGFPDPYCAEGVGCDDWRFEDPAYGTDLTFDTLKTRAFTFGAGLYVQPVEAVGVSVAYSHGLKNLAHEGGATLDFACPSDALGAIAAQTSGLCDADANAESTITYNLPSRINAGVVLTPVDKVRAELMGGWVGWSTFSDYNIQTRVTGKEFEDELCVDGDGNSVECTESQTTAAAETADLVSQDRQWARENRNTFWVGADGKFQVHKFLTLGARAIFDKSAIPIEYLSTNNYDANSFNLSAVAVVTPIEQLGIGLSFGQQLLASRTVDNSAFAVTLDESKQLEDRYFYPTANGTYSGSISRIGISVQGKFLAKD